jgi:hypothetical protein
MWVEVALLIRIVAGDDTRLDAGVREVENLLISGITRLCKRTWIP